MRLESKRTGSQSPVHIPKNFSNPKIQASRHLTPKFQIPLRIVPEKGLQVWSQSTRPISPLSKSTSNCSLSASFRNSLSSSGPDTRNPTFVQGAPRGCPLRQNHRDPVFDTAAQDAARDSSSNSWNCGPDRRCNIPSQI